MLPVAVLVCGSPRISKAGLLLYWMAVQHLLLLALLGLPNHQLAMSITSKSLFFICLIEIMTGHLKAWCLN